jgi:hypothetical protein
MAEDGMKVFVGLDVSLSKTSICGISAHGKIIKEAETESAPEGVLHGRHALEGRIATIGLAAGPLSQWRYLCLIDAGLDVVLMETRQVKGALWHSRSALPLMIRRAFRRRRRQAPGSV